MPKLTQLIRKIWDSKPGSLAPDSVLPTLRLPCPSRAHSKCSMKAGQYESKISPIPKHRQALYMDYEGQKAGEGRHISGLEWAGMDSQRG